MPRAAPPYYPVLYVKNAKRVPANRRVVTGEIVAALNPGISAEEIARDYNLNAMPAGASMVGLARFVARSGFKAMELVSKLRLDARVAIADHDLVKMIAPKAFIPNDPLFNDQWALLPGSLASVVTSGIECAPAPGSASVGRLRQRDRRNPRARRSRGHRR